MALESKKIRVVAGPSNPALHFHKDWIPEGVMFTPLPEGAQFFRWTSPTEKEYYVVPWELLGQVNIWPVDAQGTAKVYPRPCEEIPAGMKLVYDGVILPGRPGDVPMKLVPLDTEDLTTDEMIAAIYRTVVLKQ